MYVAIRLTNEPIARIITLSQSEECKKSTVKQDKEWLEHQYFPAGYYVRAIDII
jgi:hypothetical protein